MRIAPMHCSSSRQFYFGLCRAARQNIARTGHSPQDSTSHLLHGPIQQHSSPQGATALLDFSKKGHTFRTSQLVLSDAVGSLVEIFEVVPVMHIHDELLKMGQD